MAHVRREIFHIDKAERIGERLRVDGRISRVGVQIYTDKTGGSRREYRPPDEVFSQESLDSLKSMPITIQHPPTGMVTRDNYRRLNVGHVGEDVRKDSDNTHVLATLWILDGRAIEKVESGKLTELSVGYWASLDAQSGTTPDGEKYDAIQKNIVGNHLALLETGQARGGPSLRMVLDANDDVIMAENKKERITMKIKVDGVDYDTENAALAQAIEKERLGLIERADRSDKERDELKAKCESLEDNIVSLEKKLDKATNPDNIAKIADERARVISDAFKVAGEFEPPIGSNHDIKKAALEKAGIKLSLDSEDYVSARFEAALENIDKSENQSLKKARKSTSVKTDSVTNNHPGVHLDRGLVDRR